MLYIKLIKTAPVIITVRLLVFSFLTSLDKSLLLILLATLKATLRTDSHPAMFLIILGIVKRRLASLDAMFLKLLLIPLTEIRQRIQQPLLHGFLAIGSPAQFLTDVDNVGDVLDVRNIFFRVVRDCDATLTTCTSGASNPVDVDGRRIGNIVVDDAVDAAEVNPAG